MKAYMGKDTKTGRHMVYVEHQGVKPFYEYHDTAEQANESIINDYKEEREGNLFK